MWTPSVNFHQIVTVKRFMSNQKCCKQSNHIDSKLNSWYWTIYFIGTSHGGVIVGSINKWNHIDHFDISHIFLQHNFSFGFFFLHLCFIHTFFLFGLFLGFIWKRKCNLFLRNMVFYKDVNFYLYNFCDIKWKTVRLSYFSNE